MRIAARDLRMIETRWASSSRDHADRGTVRRMNARRALSGAVPIHVAAMLVGCGGSSGLVSPSKDGFVAAAGEICADFNTRFAASPRSAGRGIEASRLERQHALRESELSQLRALTSAPGQRRAYAALLADLSGESKLSGVLVDVLKTHGYQGYLKFQSATEQGPRLAVKTRRDAAALRLNKCAGELVFSRPAIGG
jgi:hypothetical protein